MTVFVAVAEVVVGAGVTPVAVPTTPVVATLLLLSAAVGIIL